MSAYWTCHYCNENNLGSTCPCGRPDERDNKITELREGLRKYGRHLGVCQSRVTITDIDSKERQIFGCDCGLDELLGGNGA